jgi:hypothetical protein
MRNVLKIDGFAAEAKAMRAHFEERFAEPRSADSGRFVWDYWHVPGQYTALRTPAYHYFPAKLYRAFHERLVLWGRRNLGCHDVSPPWLSCYVDGGRQEFHSDLPHGPWAFVYSLTPWETRKFIGGQTLLLQPEMLDYWRNLDRFAGTHGGMEEAEILQEIEPRFNRLTVFDPRIPHGVRRVENVWDPRQGRLVIHGWFMQPRPFIEGPLRRASLQRWIDRLGPELDQAFPTGMPVRGILSLRFSVDAMGAVSGIKPLSNTLVAIDGDEQAAPAVLKTVRTLLKRASFGSQRGLSEVTLPIILSS